MVNIMIQKLTICIYCTRLQFYFILFFVLLGLKYKTSNFLGKKLTTWATFLTLAISFIFQAGSSFIWGQLGTIILWPLGYKFATNMDCSLILGHANVLTALALNCSLPIYASHVAEIAVMLHHLGLILDCVLSHVFDKSYGLVCVRWKIKCWQ